MVHGGRGGHAYGIVSPRPTSLRILKLGIFHSFPPILRQCIPVRSSGRLIQRLSFDILLSHLLLITIQPSQLLFSIPPFTDFCFWFLCPSSEALPPPPVAAVALKPRPPRPLERSVYLLLQAPSPRSSVHSSPESHDISTPCPSDVQRKRTTQRSTSRSKKRAATAAAKAQQQRQQETSQAAAAATAAVEEEESDGTLYCLCRQPNDPSRFMLACDRCSEWYHGECVNVSGESPSPSTPTFLFFFLEHHDEDIP